MDFTQKFNLSAFIFSRYWLKDRIKSPSIIPMLKTRERLSYAKRTGFAVTTLCVMFGLRLKTGSEDIFVESVNYGRPVGQICQVVLSMENKCRFTGKRKLKNSSFQE